MRSYTGLFAVVLGLSVALLTSPGREPDKGKESELMRRKLASSQKVLEGLTTIEEVMRVTQEDLVVE